MKIAIVGTAESAKESPFKDDSWQIWSLGANHLWIPRFDRWFELHSMLYLENEGNHPSFFAHLAKCEDRLYLTESSTAYPKAKLYPKDEIKQKYGTYFTSSIAWMFIQAIYEGATEIGIWGVDMRGDGEYGQQRPCMEYWIGRAIEKGIKVHIHRNSVLLKGEPYEGGIYYQILGLAKTEKQKMERLREQANYQVGFSDALEMIRRRFG